MSAIATGVGAAALACAVVALPGAESDASVPRCSPVEFAVPLTEQAPADERVSGTLCVPRGRAATAVQVLVPGGTYGQDYWVLRGDPRKPSYVEQMTGAGYATLAIDRFGAGASSAPPSENYAAETPEVALHAVLEAVRAGVGEHRFDHVVLVGHSYGSTLARLVAIHHPDDVDALILTGEASRSVELPWDEVIHAAAEDPVLAGRGLDAGYYTTRPGMRGKWFYEAGTADPAVVAADERTKQADVFSARYPLPEENAAIGVPVLIVVGAHDRIVCASGGSNCTDDESLFAQERPFYPNAELAAIVVPGTGHSLNLHRTAPDWQRRAADWLDEHLR
ncbi:alpha/beta hydrolase [Saccharopolyspora sp. 5N708]|uniref:alpha/beta hydrolase n=1 Tax=Saccharopolyspora sp. 5N708 TaxID=3457424 RepID=UPI003FD5F771